MEKKVSYKDAVQRLDKSVKKQHDYRHLPRTRCVTTWNERLEFILAEGMDAHTFCQGERTLNPTAHQVVYPGTYPGLLEIIHNFDTGKTVYVIPEERA